MVRTSRLDSSRIADVALKHNESAGQAYGILNPARLERRIVRALWLDYCLILSESPN